MVDSRQKGARAEAAIAKLLKQDTGLNWKRVPGSGALHEDHMLKGDIYVPNEHNFWAIEVKHYKEPHLTSNVLTDKEPQLLKWWSQATRQAEQTNKKPMLFFKHDRSKWFVMLPRNEWDWDIDKAFIIVGVDTIVMEYSKFIEFGDIRWIK